MFRGEPGDCAKSVPVALKFWGIDARKGLTSAANSMRKFDTVILMERYNESLAGWDTGDVCSPFSRGSCDLQVSTLRDFPLVCCGTESSCLVSSSLEESGPFP